MEDRYTGEEFSRLLLSIVKGFRGTRTQWPQPRRASPYAGGTQGRYGNDERWQLVGPYRPTCCSGPRASTHALRFSPSPARASAPDLMAESPVHRGGSAPPAVRTAVRRTVRRVAARTTPSSTDHIRPRGRGSPRSAASPPGGTTSLGSTSGHHNDFSSLDEWVVEVTSERCFVGREEVWSTASRTSPDDVPCDPTPTSTAAPGALYGYQADTRVRRRHTAPIPTGHVGHGGPPGAVGAA